MATTRANRQRAGFQPRTARKPAAGQAELFSTSKRPAKGESEPSDALLTPLEWHALSIAGKKATKHRDALRVAIEQPVDVTLRIRGNVDVAAEASETKTEKPSVDRLLGVCLWAVGAQSRKAIIAAVVKQFSKVSDAEFDKALEQQVQQVMEKITRETAKPKRGAVTGALNVELIGRGK